MSVSTLEKVFTYLRGFALGDADLALKFVDPANYVEHNPLVAAQGVAGVREHILSLPRGGVTLDVIRVLQDGAFVVTQAQGDVHGQNVFFDVFRHDDGLIVEHWAFTAQAAPPNKSGHTQADGPLRPQDYADTEKNKALVRDYYQTVHLAGKRDQARRWFFEDYCVRHEPGVADGVNEFLHDLDVLVRDRTIDRLEILLGEGDFVFLIARGTVRGQPCVYVDLYRVEHEKIVEHWGFPQLYPVPA